jgi:hypothetical protein
MSIQYVNQSHYFDHFLICQEANGVSKESNLLHNFTSSYQTRVTKVATTCDK